MRQNGWFPSPAKAVKGETKIRATSEPITSMSSGRNAQGRKKMKVHNLKNRPKAPKELYIVTGQEPYDYAEEWFEEFEKKFKKMDFFEWIQENQEDLPLGYTKAQLLELFVKKEILG